MPAIFAVRKTKRVIELGAVVEDAAREQLGDELGIADGDLLEIGLPTHQVGRRRDEAGSACRIEVGDAESKGAVVGGDIAVGLAADDLVEVVAEERTRHPERLEEALGGEFAERLPRNAGDNLREQGIARV